MKFIGDELNREGSRRFRAWLRRHRNYAGVLLAVAGVVSLAFASSVVVVAATEACGRLDVDCTPWSRPKTDAIMPTCDFEFPTDNFHIAATVNAIIECEDGVPLERTIVLVHGPFGDGVTPSRSAPYPMYPRDDAKIYSEIVAGTPSAYDDGKTFIACITVLTSNGMRAVREYWATDDRSGIPELPEEERRITCRFLTHDPKATG